MEHVRQLEPGPASLDDLLVPVVLRRYSHAVDEHQADHERDGKSWTQPRQLERCKGEEHSVQSLVVPEMDGRG